MRDRLITALGALGALAVVYALFLKRPSEPPVTRPLSIEAGPNGYLALATWLKGQGVSTVSWRQRFGALADAADLPAAGNVMITTMPYATPLRSDEYLKLKGWIEAGNTVLILAALDDTPDWSSFVASAFLMRDVTWFTGLTFSAYQDGSGSGAPTLGNGLAPEPPVAAESPVELEPAEDHPLLRGVMSLHGFSDRPSALWSASYPDSDAPVLTLATERSHGLDALWELPRGRGQVLLAASGTLLANRNIGEGDARELVANLIARHLAPGGAVIFDDMHQGLSSLYDAPALFRDPRLRYTLAFLLAAWAIYVLGSSNRLSPPVRAEKVPRPADFLAAAGGFMARRLDRRDAALLLFEEWFAEVRRHRGEPASPSPSPPWAELEATPTLSRRLYEELREGYRRLQSGRAVDLARLHNTLQAAREAIG